MFGSIGGPELIVIFVVALLIFGPRRLAEVGRAVGKGIAEFRRAATDLKETLDAEVARAEPLPRDRSLAARRAADGEASGAKDAETPDERR